MPDEPCPRVGHLFAGDHVGCETCGGTGRVPLGSGANRYPRGKLNATDLGSTQIAVTVKDGTFVIAFTKPMDWIGLGYEEAKALGECLLKRAEEIRQ